MFLSGLCVLYWINQNKQTVSVKLYRVVLITSRTCDWCVLLGENMSHWETPKLSSQQGLKGATAYINSFIIPSLSSDWEFKEEKYWKDFYSQEDKKVILLAWDPSSLKHAAALVYRGPITNETVTHFGRDPVCLRNQASGSIIPHPGNLERSERSLNQLLNESSYVLFQHGQWRNCGCRGLVWGAGRSEPGGGAGYRIQPPCVCLNNHTQTSTSPLSGTQHFPTLTFHPLCVDT